MKTLGSWDTEGGSWPKREKQKENIRKKEKKKTLNDHCC